MAIESKINKLVNHFRVYKPKIIDRAIDLLRLYGDASDEQIVHDIEQSIRIRSMSDEELNDAIKGFVERTGGRPNNEV
jgi:hypothetical protein